MAGGVVLTEKQTNEANALKADLETCFAEKYASFLNGVKPLSEWDSYISVLISFGLDKLTAIYQAAYDEYKSNQ